MKVELLITKNGASIYSGAHDISDAESFGKACADAWSKIRQDRLGHETGRQCARPTERRAHQRVEGLIKAVFAAPGFTFSKPTSRPVWVGP